MRLKPSLESADAALVLDAGLAQARAMGAPVCIAVVDEAGVLVTLRRLDGAKPHSVDLATRKARTAAALGLSTAVLEQMAREGRLPGGEVLALGGGRPLTHGGETAGGVGVSGSTPDADDVIAGAAVGGLPAGA